MNAAKHHPPSASSDGTNGTNGFASLQEWLNAQAGRTLADYDRRLHASLSSQDSHRATQRALVGAIEALFESALGHLPGPHAGGDTLATMEAQLQGFLASFLGDVLSHNRRSCALTNFPQEHRPDSAYVQDMARDLEAVCRALLRDAAALDNLSRTLGTP